MKNSTMQNLHVPLPEALYQRLREEAKRSSRPATELAREAIDRWLSEARRKAIHREIARYAEECSGTQADLDPSLEAAGIECLIGKKSKRK